MASNLLNTWAFNANVIATEEQADGSHKLVIREAGTPGSPTTLVNTTAFNANTLQATTLTDGSTALALRSVS